MLFVLLLLAPCLSQAVEPPIDKLIQDLTGQDARSRALARRLLPYQGVKAVASLIPLLTDKSAYTAKAVFDILMDIGNEASAPGRETERKIVADMFMVLIQPARSGNEQPSFLRLHEIFFSAGEEING